MWGGQMEIFEFLKALVQQKLVQSLYNRSVFHPACFSFAVSLIVSDTPPYVHEHTHMLTEAEPRREAKRNSRLISFLISCRRQMQLSDDWICIARLRCRFTLDYGESEGRGGDMFGGARELSDTSSVTATALSTSCFTYSAKRTSRTQNNIPSHTQKHAIVAQHTYY